MKKLLILLTIILISCGSDGENSNPVSIDEVNNDNVFETLDWPLDYPIFEIYECLENSGLSDLPSPEITDSEIQVKFDGGYDEAFFNEFNILIDECEVKINEDDENDDRQEATEVKEEVTEVKEEAAEVKEEATWESNISLEKSLKMILFLIITDILMLQVYECLSFRKLEMSLYIKLVKYITSCSKKVNTLIKI